MTRYNSTQKRPKLPPFGKELAARQQFNNLPFAVVICVGANAWARSKQWRKRTDIAPIVIQTNEPPERYRWPVIRCLCLVDWGIGPNTAYIIQLVRCLLQYGATSITVRPLFVDRSKPAWEYVGGQWRQVREVIRTYYGKVAA